MKFGYACRNLRLKLTRNRSLRLVLLFSSKRLVTEKYRYLLMRKIP